MLHKVKSLVKGNLFETHGLFSATPAPVALNFSATAPAPESLMNQRFRNVCCIAYKFLVQPPVSRKAFIFNVFRAIESFSATIFSATGVLASLFNQLRLLPAAPVSCDTVPGSTRIVWNRSSPQSLVFQCFPHSSFFSSLRRVKLPIPVKHR